MQSWDVQHQQFVLVHHVYLQLIVVLEINVSIHAIQIQNIHVFLSTFHVDFW